MSLLGGVTWILAEHYHEHNFSSRCIKLPLGRNLCLSRPPGISIPLHRYLRGLHSHFPSLGFQRYCESLDVLRRPQTPETSSSLLYKWTFFFLVIWRLQNIRIESEMESELWNRLKLLRETWNVPCWSLTFVTDISAPCVCYWWWRWLPFFLSLTEIPLQQLVYKSFAFSKQYFWWVFEGQPSSSCRGSKFLFRHQGLGDERHSPEREDQERSGKTNSTQWKQGKKMPRGRANKHKHILKALKGVCALVLKFHC